MEISYLGISFIESIMHIFRVIFEEVFSPVLKNILEVFVEYVI